MELEGDAVIIALIVAAPEIGIFVLEAVGENRFLSHRIHIDFRPLIITVDNSEGVLVGGVGNHFEEVGLVQAVLFNGAVELKVFMSHIGKNCYIEGNITQAGVLLGQPVAGGFQNRILHPAVSHLLQKHLNLGSFRSGLSVGVRFGYVSGLVVNGGEKSRLLTTGFKKLVDKGDGGALSICTGYADDLHLL